MTAQTQPAQTFPLAAKMLQQIGLPLHPLMQTEFADMWRLAEVFANSRCTPKGMETPEQVFVALQYGAALGLAPWPAVQNVAIIYNKPFLMYAAMLGIVQGSGQMGPEDYDETLTDTKAVVKCRRSGSSKWWVGEYSIEDAKRAQLVKKDGGYEKNPRDMLRARAGMRALRPCFADLLMGLSTSAEEATDEREAAPPTTPAAVPGQSRTDAVKAKLAAQAPKPAEAPKAVETPSGPRDPLVCEATRATLMEAAAGAGLRDRKDFGAAMRTITGRPKLVSADITEGEAVKAIGYLRAKAIGAAKAEPVEDASEIVDGETGEVIVEGAEAPAPSK